MLTIKPIGSTKEELGYYSHLGEAEHHEYYSEAGHRSGEWWGEGATLLGLEGEVDPAQFENLLKGMAPDGSKSLVQVRNGQQLKRRAGFDFTFSEVKSFDAAWSVANPERRAELEWVAEKALLRTMDVVQELCGVTRRGKDGAVQERAGLIAAVFHHDTARPIPGEVPDPKQHHHVVIANVVAREDGTFGAWDARPVFTRRMKMAVGALFRAELSMLLESELGIATYRPHKENREELESWFEIQGVPTDLMQAMSKRRQEIEKWLREHGLSGTAASQKAALSTRQHKERFTRGELSAAWKKLGQEHEFGPEVVEALFDRAPEVALDRAGEAKKAVARAVEGLIEHQARFSQNDLLERTAIEAQSQGIGIDDVLGAVSLALEPESKQGTELVRLEDMQGVRAYTTKSMLRLETRMLETARKLQSLSHHVVSEREVNRVIRDHKTVRPDQAKAIRAITTGSDITAITGVAGSGKTFMLSVCRKVLEDRGYSLIGTSLASKATRGLEKESGIRSLHIHKLLYEIEQGRLQLDAQSILVVDEAGMVGTVHMEKLARLVHKAGAKLVLVGDAKQLQAISAGAPLRAIGMEVGATEMKKIVRQREAWAREAVLRFREGEAEKALVELYERGQLFIGRDRDDAMDRLVRDWETLVFKQNEKVKETLVFAGMNCDVNALNLRLQEKMKERQQLGDYGLKLEGQAFYLGDRIMITKNYHSLNLRNGTMAEVVGVSKKRLWVLTEDGFEVEIDTGKFKDIRLGYCMTVTKSQGLTCENSLILCGDAMTDQHFAYVSGSRARGMTRMYADELSAGGIESLAAKMNVSREKEMATEHLLELA